MKEKDLMQNHESCKWNGAGFLEGTGGMSRRLGTVGGGDTLYKLRWGPTMGMPKCQEEKANLICEQCLAAQDRMG